MDRHLHIDANLHTKWRAYCAGKRKTMKEVTEALIEWEMRRKIRHVEPVAVWDAYTPEPEPEESPMSKPPFWAQEGRP